MDFIDLKKQQSFIRLKINKRIKTVLDHGKYILGPEVFELEEKIADYVGVKNCITCSSGTDALLISLLAKNIGKGDAIITTSFTYVATAEVIALIGAVPIFIDIYPSTFNLDPDKIEAAVSKSKNKGLKPKAIIAVDIFGVPARYRLIKKIAKKYNLFVIADAAQSFGSEIKGKKTGNFGDITTTSFFPAKPLGCYGDGGAIFTNENSLAKIMRSIRVHGAGKDKYENIRLGLNGRLDTIQAAILLEKLEIFDEELLYRNKIADYYKRNLNNNFKYQFIPKDYTSSWAQFSLVAESNHDRNMIIEKFKNENIPIMVYYKIPLHLQNVFNYLGYNIGDLPNTETISNRIFSIPMYPYLIEREQDKILKILNEN